MKGAGVDRSLTDRIAKLRMSMADEGLDAVMISIQENRYYLSGFTGEDTQFDESAGSLFITESRLILATDSRFELQAQAEADGFEVICYQKGIEKELPGIVKEMGIQRLGFESERLSYQNHCRYAAALTESARSTELVPTRNLVESLRQIKSEDEIHRTIQALRLAEKAFTTVVGSLRPGMTEKEIAWSMEAGMREAGAQRLSFPVIVASGPNSALPHAIPTDRRIRTGEPILIDWGACLDAYCSDTTRTLVLGHPDDRFNTVFETVVTARDKAIAAIGAGVSGTQIDKIARDHIDANGFAGKFGHGLGHGTGLAVHESPRLSPIKDYRLEAGMIVTVEPGVYLPGWGGVRMENQVVVRSDGVQVLNDPAPFDPWIRL
jgi:Xaa-Pro aminopeptidase